MQQAEDVQLSKSEGLWNFSQLPVNWLNLKPEANVDETKPMSFNWLFCYYKWSAEALEALTYIWNFFLVVDSFISVLYSFDLGNY